MVSKNTIKLVHSLETKKGRRDAGLFVAEGPKAVGDIMRRIPPAMVIGTAAWMAENRDMVMEAAGRGGRHCEMLEATPDELRRTSFLVHPQRVIALFPIPETPCPTPQQLGDRLSIALDGVQDPGNLGTIIRIADWFGIDTLLCSPDTADLYNPKVVQATMGSIARVNVTYTDLGPLFDSLGDDVPLYGTLLDGNDIYTQQLTPNGIIVMGNEGNGISPDIRRRIRRRLLIPDFSKGDTAESLNVAIATAITCSEFRRRTAGGMP